MTAIHASCIAQTFSPTLFEYGDLFCHKHSQYVCCTLLYCSMMEQLSFCAFRPAAFQKLCPVDELCVFFFSDIPETAALCGYFLKFCTCFLWYVSLHSMLRYSGVDTLHSIM
jgi:hypothetical protein